MASKRIIQKKSEKKDVNKSRLHIDKMQARSNSQCADTIAIMKEQTNNVTNSAIFSQPYKLGSKKQNRSSSDPPTCNQKSSDSGIKHGDHPSQTKG